MDETFEGRFAQAQLLWGNIAARPMRAFLNIVAITIQVFLVLMIVGLTTGVVSEWGKRVEGVGADILVQPPNSSMFLAFSRAVIPESLADKVAKLPGVDEVAPTLTLMDQKNFVLVYGIDYRRFNALSRGFLFRSEGRSNRQRSNRRRYRCAVKAFEGRQRYVAESRFYDMRDRGAWEGRTLFYPAENCAGHDWRGPAVSMLYVRSKGDVEATRADFECGAGDGVKSICSIRR
jgi:hypothetical protein